MIPLAANIPLTLCSVVIRRFIDSYAGRLPLAVAASSVPTASTVALFSGALVCLYHQLRKGTLVKIGLGKGVSSMLRNSRHTIQRRMKNSSWFLRNLDSCRRRCAEAVLKIAQPADDSLEQIQAETGAVENGMVSGTISLPIFNRQHVSDNRRFVNQLKEPAVENLYSNRSFDCCDYSEHDITMVDGESQEEARRKQKRMPENSQRRPITRNFHKTLIAQKGCGDGRRLSSKKRKKIVKMPTQYEDDYPVDKESSEDLSPLSLTPINKVRSSFDQSRTSSKRHSDRLKKQHKIQKITRKTRSGRVYVYRL